MIKTVFKTVLKVWRWVGGYLDQNGRVYNIWIMKEQVKKIVKTVINPQVYDKVVLPRHIAESAAANIIYGFPAMSKQMTIIGITGTNGKTTTCNMLASIFDAAGKTVGMTSSATLQIGKKKWENNLHITTAKGMLLQKMLRQMKDAACDVAVLEVASHALVQHRVLGIPFDSVGYTNLTQDHLDYHGTMEKYAAAKAMLFKKAKKHAIVNADDSWVKTFSDATSAPVYSYGKEGKDLKLVSTNINSKGADFVVADKLGQQAEFHINLTGLFNVYNAMLAIQLARVNNIDDEAIRKGLSDLQSVPGRMQIIDEGQNFTVIIDHAHTPDAVENLYKAVKPTVRNKLRIVIGCDGDRDPKKREPIGRLSAQYADELYLTEVENYTENPRKILDMVIEGIEPMAKKRNIPWREIPDRKSAIFAAIADAKSGDVVLIPSIGAQDYRGMADSNGAMYKMPWDEREVVREAIRAVSKK
jgi:UDP-N-acetylmuramoyl-L-alanyl-D-glutamate--2,6-diaminopimelate ligase